MTLQLICFQPSLRLKQLDYKSRKTWVIPDRNKCAYDVAFIALQNERQIKR